MTLSTYIKHCITGFGNQPYQSRFGKSGVFWGVFYNSFSQLFYHLLFKSRSLTPNL